MLDVGLSLAQRSKVEWFHVFTLLSTILRTSLHSYDLAFILVGKDQQKVCSSIIGMISFHFIFGMCVFLEGQVIPVVVCVLQPPAGMFLVQEVSFSSVFL